MIRDKSLQHSCPLPSAFPAKAELCPMHSICWNIQGRWQRFEGHTNYLRMHFVKGKVDLMLDLAGEFDPNDYPLVVLKKSLKNGNPVWTFGGTD